MLFRGIVEPPGVAMHFLSGLFLQRYGLSQDINR